jgi:predicted nucleic acid-binding Zn ribbon protein
MNCPKCGSEIFADQQYCRSCGTVLVEESGRSFDIRFWGIAALTLLFGGLLIAMGGKMWNVKWLLFAGLVLTFTGMFGIAAFGMLQQTRSRKPRRMRDPLVRQPQLLKADTTNKLPPISDDIIPPSVVDDTTELLKVPARSNSSDRD